MGKSYSPNGLTVVSFFFFLIYLTTLSLSCHIQDLFLRPGDYYLWPMESSSLTRGLNLGPLHWEYAVLATGPPEKSPKPSFFMIK